MLLDDGTTSRSLRALPRHDHDGDAAVVLEHMEFHLQAVCPRLDVLLSDVAISGRSSRSRGRVRVRSWRGGRRRRSVERRLSVHGGERRPIAGVAGRVFRISFSASWPTTGGTGRSRPEGVVSGARGRQALAYSAYRPRGVNTLSIEKGT